MKTSIESLLCAALLMAGLTACNPVALNLEERIVGTWVECYDDPRFVMDGFVMYNIGEKGDLTVVGYDALTSHSFENSMRYALNLFGQGQITLNPHMSDLSGVTYEIVKLTRNEMAWQKEGTTFSRGTQGSDYKHFRRRTAQ